MNIKTGDYIENLRGIVGVVNTVGRPAENENGKRFAFDWDILYPEKMPGNRGFFEGDESALWKQFKRVGTYENPFLKERMGKKPIERLANAVADWRRFQDTRLPEIVYGTQKAIEILTDGMEKPYGEA